MLATGFDLWEANFPAIEVVGREGRNLGKWWRDTRFQAYQGVSMPLLPELPVAWPVPYAFLGLNFFNTMEYQMRHMDRLFGEVKRRGATTFEVTEEANTRYLDRMTELLGESLFTNGNCAIGAVVLFQPRGRTHAAAADVDTKRHQRGIRLPADRLPVFLIGEDPQCRKRIHVPRR